MTEKKRGNPALVKGGPSLNPRGRTKGSVNALTKMQNELVEQFAGEMNKDFMKILRKVITQAKDGCVQSQKILLDRALPARKAVEHYGVHEGMGGINIIIKGINDDSASVSPIEGAYTVIEEEDEDD